MGINTMAKKYTLITIFLLVLTASFSASAGTVVFDATGNDVGAKVTVNYMGSEIYSGFGGLMGLNKTGGSDTSTLWPDPVGQESKFNAFCLDARAGYSPGSEYNLSTLAQGTNMGQSKADDINRLMSNIYPDFRQGIQAYSSFDRPGFPFNYSIGVNQTALAIQIALWEIVHESGSNSGYNVYSGDIKFTWDEYAHSHHEWWKKDARELAQHFLDQWVVGQSGPGSLENLRSLTRLGAQDLLVQTPIPGAVWLFGSALVGLVGFSRRRKNQS
jgi:hypothetical protein